MSRYETEEYENWDEYESDGIDDGPDEKRVEEEYEYVEEGDEEGGEEEAPHQHTQEELDYLELRNQLKENLRKKMKKENGSSLGHSEERKRKLPYDNYGSFFGPSQPVIAQRVIQESKSLLENERLTTKVLKPNHSNKTSSASTSASGGSKNTTHVSRPKTVNQLKSKVENVKFARDYSFLLSDDAEVPTTSKDPPRNVSRGPTSDARSAQVPPKNKQLSNSNGRVDQRQVQNGSRKVHSESRQASSGSRPASNGNRLSSNGDRQTSNGNRFSSIGDKQTPNGNRLSSTGDRQTSNGNRLSSTGDRQTSNGSKHVSNRNRQLSNGREEKKYVSGAGNSHHRTDPHKLNPANKPISKPLDSRKQQLNNNGSGPGRPMPSKPLPSKVPPGTMQKKIPLSGPRPNSSSHGMPNSSSTKLQSSSSKQPMVSKQSTAMKQPLDQRKEYQDWSKGKIFSKQPVLSRHQISKPTTKAPSRPPLEKDRAKKRPVGPFDDEEELDGDVSSMIRKLMGYNPDKYRGRDLGDDRNMEANLDEIWREEERSLKIAKMEDEEELRKLEEEEERRLNKAKKRKISH